MTDQTPAQPSGALIPATSVGCAIWSGFPAEHFAWVRTIITLRKHPPTASRSTASGWMSFPSRTVSLSVSSSQPDVQLGAWTGSAGRYPSVFQGLAEQIKDAVAGSCIEGNPELFLLFCC